MPRLDHIKCQLEAFTILLNLIPGKVRVNMDIYRKVYIARRMRDGISREQAEKEIAPVMFTTLAPNPLDFNPPAPGQSMAGMKNVSYQFKYGVSRTLLEVRPN